MNLNLRMARLEAARTHRVCAVCRDGQDGVVVHPPAVARCMADLLQHQHWPEFCPACGRQTVFVIPSPALEHQGVRACA